MNHRSPSDDASFHEIWVAATFRLDQGSLKELRMVYEPHQSRHSGSAQTAGAAERLLTATPDVPSKSNQHPRTRLQQPGVQFSSRTTNHSVQPHLNHPATTKPLN
ncbi:hypothetical protein D9613_012690 [Agrocybe pediades]|uniref:Uncharacterized protein n=1 Tax=Agrocybe pediades TaxID=84607 RepID=A0A8H4VK39_9AGAR|nr:hypothetical protein D9613_012690 [Agrocybe pediades]